MTRIQALRARWRRVDARRKILLWATLAAMLCGLLRAGSPVEERLRMMRNTFHKRSPSGQIVVVGVDDKSLHGIGQWPWPRSRHAQLIDHLREAGARKMFFDISFMTASTPQEDSALAAALARAPGKVVLPVRFSEEGGQRTELLPIPMFRRHAELASIDGWYSFTGAITQTPYSVRYASGVYPTIEASMANLHGGSGSFSQDHSISYRDIPFISAIDIVSGRFDPRAVRGKRVLIGVTSDLLGDLIFFPDGTYASGVFSHAVGAETLMHGRPVHFGWLLPALFGLAISVAYLFSQRRWLSAGTLAAGVLGLFIAAGILERGLIFTDIFPALFLIAVVAVCAESSRLRTALRTRGKVNQTSGLPNLTAFRDMSDAQREVVIAARVRNFPEITATLAPESETMLVQRIVARLNFGGNTMVYHGDEGIFAWFSDLASSQAGEQLDALHALCRSPIDIDGRQVDLNIAFGLETSASRSPAHRLASALVAADEAAEHGLRWKLFDPATLLDADWRLSLLGQLDTAIEQGQVWVAYQPKLDLKTRRITGAEALVRWTHPEKGEISPEEFVIAAEQHGRIDRLTDYVLDQALRAAAAVNMRSKGFDIAVNISTRVLDDATIVDRVKTALARHRVPAQSLILEVTESAAMASSSQCLAVLDALRALGVGISVDDYGTGMSTLEYLKTIPSTEIKIDRRFVAAMVSNRSDRLLVGSTIQLAQSLGRTVVAEGVESREILDALIELGCDKAQGYYLGRPMKLTQLLKAILSVESQIAA